MQGRRSDHHEVAVDLDLTETALRGWVKRADIDAGKGPPGERDDERLYELTMAAAEGRADKTQIADELRKLVDETRG